MSVSLFAVSPMISCKSSAASIFALVASEATSDLKKQFLMIPFILQPIQETLKKQKIVTLSISLSDIRNNYFVVRKAVSKKNGKSLNIAQIIAEETYFKAI